MTSVPPPERAALLAGWAVGARAADWLAATHPRPGEVQRMWLEGSRALLPAGIRWDAVKVPASIMFRLAGGDDPERVRAILAERGATGPVIVDPRHSYYLLVPPGTAAAWSTHGAACLGLACYLSVPAPSRTSPPETHWLTPPDGTGRDLCNPHAVAGLLRAALGPRGKG